MSEVTKTANHSYKFLSKNRELDYGLLSILIYLLMLFVLLS